MLEFSLWLSVALAAQAVLGNPVQSRSPYKVKEVHHAPDGWTLMGQAPRNHELRLQIALKQPRFHEFTGELLAVSDPHNLRYGKHLSKEELYKLIGPSKETLGFAHEWLSDNKIPVSGHSPAKDWIRVHMDVGTAERLLGTTFSLYKHNDGTQLIRTTEWSLPEHLHDEIDTIQPTTEFMRFQPQAVDWRQHLTPYVPSTYRPPRTGAVANVCSILKVTIECLRTLYGTKDYQPKAPAQGRIGFNLLHEAPVRHDTDMFLKKYRPDAARAAYNFQSVGVDGKLPPSNDNLTTDQVAKGVAREANLDAQAMLGLTYPIPVTSYATGGRPPLGRRSPDDTEEDSYLTLLNHVLALEQPPQVISSSYSDEERALPKAYAERICRTFAALGARGVSVLVSSGDNGLGGEDAAACPSKHFGKNGRKSIEFIPSFPASCPYVTTVGATEQFQPEVAAWRPSRPGLGGVKEAYFASGSGFSNYFSRPAYQEKIVEEYVSSVGNVYDGFYNKGGRGYPDISAQGLNFVYIWNGKNSAISGTSVSSPVAASVIGLLNDHLISTGRPPLGFLNPWLYQKGHKGFNDVFLGRTTSCGTRGFPVRWGWDPATGFGTPNFQDLVRVVDGNSTLPLRRSIAPGARSLLHM
ncbi:hypothetical protein PZA11_005130 [Diplocarpon coronariae]|nr:hypothetical protein JHW43_002689 [Diplocarpon mali]